MTATEFFTGLGLMGQLVSSIVICWVAPWLLGGTFQQRFWRFCIGVMVLRVWLEVIK